MKTFKQICLKDYTIKDGDKKLTLKRGKEYTTSRTRNAKPKSQEKVNDKPHNHHFECIFCKPHSCTAEIIAELERLWNKLPQAHSVIKYKQGVAHYYHAYEIDGLIQDRIKDLKAKETQL